MKGFQEMLLSLDNTGNGGERGIKLADPLIIPTWHPAFRLPLTITEAGKVTTFTYDASGSQLSRTIN